jgi:hypothetical protein
MVVMPVMMVPTMAAIVHRGGLATLLGGNGEALAASAIEMNEGRTEIRAGAILTCKRKLGRHAPMG